MAARCCPILIWALILGFSTIAQGAFHNFCHAQPHFSGFEYGCCNGSMLDLGIDLNANWKVCATPAKNTAEIETVPQTMWRVYSCIVKVVLKKKALTLKNYATAMSANYPKPIKTQILEIVKDFELKTNDMSPQEKLNAIRVTYHNIEKGVCTGNPEEISLEKLTSCTDSSDILRENTHNRGDCCLGEQIPVRLTYLRREPSTASQECTLELIKRGGELSKYEFKGGKYNKAASIQTYETKTFFNASDAQQMCLQACIAMVDLGAETKISPLPFNFTVFTTAVSAFLSEPIQQKIFSQFETDLHSEVDNTVYRIMPHVIQSEFSRLANQTYLNLILNTCESYNLAVRKIESALFGVCRK